MVRTSCAPEPQAGSDVGELDAVAGLAVCGELAALDVFGGLLVTVVGAGTDEAGVDRDVPDGDGDGLADA